jgi:phage-related protein
MTLPVFRFLIDANNAIRTNAYRTKSVQFGDGYKQLAPAGINNKLDTWNLTLPMLSELEVSLVEAFFDNLGQHANFNWTPPRGVVGIYRLIEPIKYQANGLDRLGKTRTTVTLSIEKLTIDTTLAGKSTLSVINTDKSGWTILRSGSFSSTITVNYQLTVALLSGESTTTIASISIPSFAGSSFVPVSISDTPRSETLTILPGTGYILGSPDTSIINITDPLFAQVVLLMPMNSTSGITDLTGKITANQGVTISTAILDPFGQSAGVISFPGGGSRISVNQSSDFAFGSGALAIEWWLYPTAIPTGVTWGLMDTRIAVDLSNWILSGNSAGMIGMFDNSYVTTPYFDFTLPALILNQWNYICFSRSNVATEKYKLWINGSLIMTATTRNNSITANGNLIIGDQVDSLPSYNGSFTGFGSNCRITRAYRNGSIVPTAPFPTS